MPEPRRRDPSTETIHRKTCPLCECMCGLDVHVDQAQQVTLIRGAKEDIWSKGYICPKGSALGHLHHDPDRIRQPMVRDGDQWREVSWDEAMQRCQELIHPIVAEHGPEAMTVFIGNPVGHSYNLPRYMGMMMGPGRIPYSYSAGTVDQWPKNVSSMLLYGNMWIIPVPDVTRTDYWLLMGGNPHASGGSLMAQPDTLGEIEKIRARGGKVVVVDPRRTRTADVADEWIGIQPGTDAAWLLAIINVLFAEGKVDLGHMAPLVEDVDQIRELCQDYTPESVEALTRVPAETTRRIAHEIAAANAASIYGRIGLCNQEFGTLASWLVDVLAIVSGHFDRPGCLQFAKPVPLLLRWFQSTKKDGPAQFGRWRSRVRDAPEILGQFPCSCLAEEIATPGPGQVKGLITVAANPAISVPDSDKLEEALPSLDCLIAIDNYLNETSRHAHVILPGPSPLESPHFDDLLWALSTRSVGKWTDPVFAQQGMQEWEIQIRLGQMIMGKRNDEIDVAAVDDAFFRGLCLSQGQDPAHIMSFYEHGGPDRLVDWTVRMGPFGDRFGENPGGVTLQDFKDNPDGLDFGMVGSRAAEAICTPDDKIHLAPAYITDDLPRLRARLDAPVDGMVLVSRRHLRSKNTWLHNVKVLMKGKDRCTLMVHPADAARIGVSDGGQARVSSESGTLVAPVEVTDEMMPGIVSLPHGWGHDKPGTRLSVAREHPGVNNNVLCPGEFVDVPSGNAAVNGIPVEVVPA